MALDDGGDFDGIRGGHGWRVGDRDDGNAQQVAAGLQGEDVGDTGIVLAAQNICHSQTHGPVDRGPLEGTQEKGTNR